MIKKNKTQLIKINTITKKLKLKNKIYIVVCGAPAHNKLKYYFSYIYIDV